MLLNVEKGIRGSISHLIFRYAKANNKYMKDYDRNKESSYLQNWDINDLYAWSMLQKLPVRNLERIEDTSQSNEDFIKNYNKKSKKGYFPEIDVTYTEKLHQLHDLPFLSEKNEDCKSQKACR